MRLGIDRREFVATLAVAGAVPAWATPRPAARDAFVLGAQRGSVSSDHLWTPGRGEGDVVTQSSVQSLPLNVWVKVAGTHLDALNEVLVAKDWRIEKKDWSNGKKLRSTFAAWGGCARDGLRIYHPRGGGHADSSVNGTWVFDVATMRWGAVDMPSDPVAAGMEWDASYRIPPNGSFTRYTAELPSDDGLFRDMLPDGKPTSAHVYCGVWYDSKRHCIGTGRFSKWTFDLSARRWRRERWTWEGGKPTTFAIHQQFHYHSGRDAVYGYPGRTSIDYYSFGKCPAGAANWQALRAAPNWSKVGISSCRLNADRILFLWFHKDADRWGIYDMAKEEWLEGSGDAIVNGEAYSSRTEMTPAVLVPTWGTQGQVIRRSTGSAPKEAWWLFDLASKANVPYERQGARAAKYAPYPGNKWLCVEEAGMCLMLDDQGPSTQPAVLVMRYR